jgi:hypothetical protein
MTPEFVKTLFKAQGNDNPSDEEIRKFIETWQGLENKNSHYGSSMQQRIVDRRTDSHGGDRAMLSSR